MAENEKETKEKEAEMIPADDSSILSVSTDIDSVDQAIAKATKAIEFWNRVEKLALKRTNHRDWVDEGGFPYLTAPGAEKIAGPFGVKIYDVSSDRRDRKDDKGEYYFYEFKGKAVCRFSGMMIETVGTCSSRDKFFSTAYGKELPQSDVDETNILKAAYSNFIHNAVTKVLGMRNLTWEDIKAAGVDVSQVAKVSYKTKGTTSGGSTKSKGNPEDEITPPQVGRLWAIANKQDIKKDSVMELIAEYGYKTPAQIKRKDYDEIVKKIEG